MKKTEIKKVAWQLLREHNLTAWKFELRSNMGYFLGGCDYKAKKILINDYYCEHSSKELVLDTLRHEIAHALTPGHNHDDVWKAMAEKLGCKPEASWKWAGKIKPGKYQAICPTCKEVFHKYRKPKYIRGYYCPKCGKEHGKLSFQPQENSNEE